jgi:poly-gamma-glutamate synthesis protein (capsule biosynthesis protein)
VVNLNDVVTPLQDYDLKEIEKFIKKVKREKNIIVIIFIHRGREYFLEPTKRQIELGHKFIDWGADLVVGSHPHVIQPLEIYK